VRAGDGDRAPGRGDRGQDLRSAQDGDAALLRGLHLGVGRRHGGGDGDGVGAGRDVGGVMADVDVDTERLESGEPGRRLEVAARDGVAHAGEDRGDRAHARAADADDVDALRRAEVD